MLTMHSSLSYLKKLELFKVLDENREKEFFAIVDQRVKNHLPQWIQFSTHVFWLSNPEDQKNLEDYARAVEFLLRQGIHRKSVLHAIGGGATTDFAGFVAATILRGIPWVAIPTSLLAMIDGSIGGKVALNLSQGKNLIGAFHLPARVLISGDFLTTLSQDEWLSGKGEVLKYAFLSREINALVRKKTPIEEIAVACANYKTQIVDEDYKESGKRILLNLGHTMGHAFELGLGIPHGIAVAMGLKYLFTLFDQTENLNEWNTLTEALGMKSEKLELSHYPNFSRVNFLKLIEQDKKKRGTSIQLVMVRDVGSCYIEEIPLKDFKQRIEEKHEFSY